ncbi:hypothetical protein MTOK_24730 [Mycolicibacterium tokaiense]|nr:hypothetical protein MTOK_24730 [Mycolicibacterium tokaiense]
MYNDDDTWNRIAEANAAAGIDTDWSVAERDQTEALADDLNRELERFPVVHAWRNKSGSQLQFWCRFCKSHHFHGRHGGNPDTRGPGAGSVLPVRLWKRYIKKFDDCTFRFGRGFCTCPAGCADGHRAPHCSNRQGDYYTRGYILHEVEPNDYRATSRKPPSPDSGNDAPWRFGSNSGPSSP